MKNKNNNYYPSASIYDEELLGWKKQLALNLFFWLTVINAFLFFLCWCVVVGYESLVISDSNFISKVFYFANPNLWNKFIFTTNYLQIFVGAANNKYVLFLVFFYWSVLFFIFLNICSFCLIAIAFKNNNEEMKIIGTVSLLPIFNVFIYMFFLFHKMILHFDKKLKNYMIAKDNFYLLNLQTLIKRYINFITSKTKILKEEDKHEILKINKESDGNNGFRKFINKKLK